MHQLLERWPTHEVRLSPALADDGHFRGDAVLNKPSASLPFPELLRILNWIASPFGSQEHLLMRYGVKDVDYTPRRQRQPDSHSARSR